MKKTILMILLAGMLFCVQGCSKEEEKEEPESSIEEVSEVSEESKDEPEYSIQPLLKGSFGKLDEVNSYYVETDMTVESIRSPDIISRYSLTVAIDKKTQKGMRKMVEKDEYQNENIIDHIIINKTKVYFINDYAQNYRTEDFKSDVQTFGKVDTTEMMKIGITENLFSEGSGQAQIILEGAEEKIIVDYERYRLSAGKSSAPSENDTYITYYFKDKKPVLEIMENTEGKTTFTFRTIEYKVPDETIFEIDPYYYETN